MGVFRSSHILRFFLLSFLGLAAQARLKGKFVIIGDTHFDPTYYDAGDSCNKFVEKQQRKSRPYGHYECDTSLELMKSTFEQANKEAQDADFVVFAGDMVQHARDKAFLNEGEVLDIVRTGTATLRDLIDDNIEIIPVLGNHDYYPTSQLPAVTNNVMNELGNIYGDTFNLRPSEIETFKKGGYYSRLLDGKLRLMVLNTNLYKPSNRITDPATIADPADQFAWMRQELRKARDNNERVHIMLHIPPGMSESQDIPMFKEQYNKDFNSIILEYADVISGIQGAHTHSDSFRFYYKDSVPVAPILLGPAVTPWRRRAPGSPPKNPAVRSVYFSPTGDMKLLDYTQFYMELDKANQGDPKWKEEYQFTQAYGTNDISPASLKAVVQSFSETDNKKFNKYCIRNLVKIANATDFPADAAIDCDCQWKAVHMCSFHNLEYSEYDKCKSETVKQYCSGGRQLMVSMWVFLLAVCSCLSF